MDKEKIQREKHCLYAKMKVYQEEMETIENLDQFEGPIRKYFIFERTTDMVEKKSDFVPQSVTRFVTQLRLQTHCHPFKME